MNQKKILLINLAGLGDIVLSSTALGALRQRYPESRIHLLTFKKNAGLVEACPYLDGIFLFDRALSLKNLSTLFQIRRVHFDAVVNLYNINSFPGSLKMFLLSFIIGAKETYGRNTDGHGFFYRHSISESWPFSRHEVYAMLEVAGLLGAQSEKADLELWIKENTSVLENFLRGNHIADSDRLAFIHPGASRKSHCWKKEYFAQVAERLAKEHGFKIIFTGSKDEELLISDIQKRMQAESTSLCNLKMEDFISCLRRANLFITNDTGPMHLANALRIPLVVISGNSPEAFLPFRRENTIVLRRKLRQDSPLNDLACLEAISPDEVFNAAKTLLTKHSDLLSYSEK